MIGLHSFFLINSPLFTFQLELLASPTCSCECALLMNTVGEIVDILTQDKDQSHSNLYASRDEALQQMEAVTLPPEGAKPREDTAAATTLCWSPPEVMYVMYTSGSTGKPKVIRWNIQKLILPSCSGPVFIYSL